MEPRLAPSVRTDKRLHIVMLAAFITGVTVFHVSPVSAQSLTVQDWVDQFVASCVGSGSSDTASGIVDANGDISLKRLALSGNVKGEVAIQHKDARLLSEGISNAMSNVAADEADKVRTCMGPLRATLLGIMQKQFTPAGISISPIYVLSPDEDKIMRALAQSDGDFHERGKLVPDDSIKSAAKLGDIRYRAALRLLEDKGYAVQLPRLNGGQCVSLMPLGDEYVLRVGFES